MGDSIKKYNIYFFFSFFRETHFHSVITQMQGVVTIHYHCIVFLLPFNDKQNKYIEDILLPNAVKKISIFHKCIA